MSIPKPFQRGQVGKHVLLFIFNWIAIAFTFVISQHLTDILYHFKIIMPIWLFLTTTILPFIYFSYLFGKKVLKLKRVFVTNIIFTLSLIAVVLYGIWSWGQAFGNSIL